MSKRVGHVTLAGRPAGILEELDGGKTRFTYLPQWLQRRDGVAISLTLPLRPEPYESEGLHQ